MHNSPIKALYDAIINNFYNRNDTVKNRFDQYYLEGSIFPGINFDPSPFGISTPSVDLITKKINVPQYYLTYLWCVVYTFINIIEKGLPKSIQNARDITSFRSNDPSLRQLDQIFGWALSLKFESSDWPTGFPKPSDISLEVRKANILFLDAIAYVMYHEVAHVVNGHWNFYQTVHKKKVTELTDEEGFMLKAIETEADNFAYECLIIENDIEESQYHKALAVAISILANLYLIDDMASLNQCTHPDPDIRVYNLLNKMKFLNPGYQFHIFNTFNVGISLFLHLNKLSYLQPVCNVDTYEEILEHLFNVIQEEKKRHL